ncbi:hypothetical protein [Flavobacterium sp.]|uniref:hypothetical protein n=1 Tax=Flavobacterium sp. TaxID=239 RepID=UPI00333EA2ED
MDELELLKKDWKKNDGQFKQVSENEIYGMLHKSSSSIVKWIFIISILEIIILRLFDLSMFFDGNYINKLKQIHIYNSLEFITIINIIVSGCFIFLFYKNIKQISSTSSVSDLMKDIIKTRKIVKYYVWYNLIIAGITGVIVIYFQSKYDANLSVLLEKYEYLFVISCALLVMFLIFVFYLFYKLLYGFLLRRLKRNYNELQKIEY